LKDLSGANSVYSPNWKDRSEAKFVYSANLKDQSGANSRAEIAHAHRGPGVSPAQAVIFGVGLMRSSKAVS
jgi:hypothetical protein